MSALSHNAALCAGLRRNGCSYREIGALLGVKEDVVRRRFSAAVATMTREEYRDLCEAADRARRWRLAERRASATLKSQALGEVVDAMARNGLSERQIAEALGVTRGVVHGLVRRRAHLRATIEQARAELLRRDAPETPTGAVAEPWHPLRDPKPEWLLRRGGRA